jgi:transcriptional regulator with XRE-family HTH domain
VPGDSALGVLLRELRTARRLTLASLAHRVGCTESLLSLVETGKRPLQPWLADQLDQQYGLSGTLAALLEGASADPTSTRRPADDTLLLRLPLGGVTVPISRRALLAAFGIGALSGAVFQAIDVALGPAAATPESIHGLETTLEGFAGAARTLPPTRLIDPLLSQIAATDVLRQRSDPAQRPDLLRLQARSAECLSWMYEETGDAANALYWVDRAVQWAQLGDWTPMVAYGFVRRSMLALSYADDGCRAVENAEVALRTPGATSRIRGLAAKQMAFGWALLQRPDDSSRALDAAMTHLSAVETPHDTDDARGVGQRSVVNDDLFTIFRATCDVYLGRGDPVIPVLQPRLESLSRASLRTHAITSAKLVNAYARAGAPELATPLLLDTIAKADSLGSLSAKRELLRAVPALTYWDRRPEIRDAIHRLDALP